MCKEKFVNVEGHSVNLWLQLEPDTDNSTVNIDHMVSLQTAQTLEQRLLLLVNVPKSCGHCGSAIYENTSDPYSRLIARFAYYTQKNCSLRTLFVAFNTFVDENNNRLVINEGSNRFVYRLDVDTNLTQEDTLAFQANPFIKTLHVNDVRICPEPQSYEPQILCPFITMSQRDIEILFSDLRYRVHLPLRKRFVRRTTYVYDICAEDFTAMFSRACIRSLESVTLVVLAFMLALKALGLQFRPTI